MAKLLAYISDEMDRAIPDALVELVDSTGGAWELRSSASGAVRADVPTGTYDVVVAAGRHGAKHTTLEVADEAPPARLRLMTDAPYGYAWPRCARAGSIVELRMHSAVPFTLSLWRYGWQPARVADLGHFGSHPPGGTIQILPDGDVAALGCDWNRRGHVAPPHPRHTARAPSRSGLYWFHMDLEDGHFFSFPLVVSPTEPRAAIAVLASDITWCAYNDFGGRSNYIAPGALPSRPSVNTRQESTWFPDPELGAWEHDTYEPLSFDRPEPHNCVGPGTRITDPIVPRGSEHLAPGEWRLLGWLEREGLDFDLYGETQLAHGTVDLDRYRVLVLSTHPEYWTRGMYETVKSWVIDGGGKLAYLGGNGINCEVTFTDPATIRVHNGIFSELKEEGQHQPDGAGRTRFERDVESEARLLGVRHTWAGFETGAPYIIEDATHWVFAGTGLRTGDVFGEDNLNARCTPRGASGHETDKLSEHAPASTALLARGANPDGGGAHMVHVTHPSGGEVFSAGSITFPCSLPVDPAVSTITRNVLRRFASVSAVAQGLT